MQKLLQMVMWPWGADIWPNQKGKKSRDAQGKSKVSGFPKRGHCPCKGLGVGELAGQRMKHGWPGWPEGGEQWVGSRDYVGEISCGWFSETKRGVRVLLYKWWAATGGFGGGQVMKQRVWLGKILPKLWLLLSQILVLFFFFLLRARGTNLERKIGITLSEFLC